MEEETIRATATIDIKTLNDNEVEFEIPLPRGTSIVGCFFNKTTPTIALAGSKTNAKWYPILVCDSDPNAEEVPHKFALIPVNVVFGHPPHLKYSSIGAYPCPNGMVFILYYIQDVE